MGIYVNLIEKNENGKERVLLTQKGGIGYAMLMFNRIADIPRSVTFEATTLEAVESITKVLDKIKQSPNRDEERVDFVREGLSVLLDEIEENCIYQCDCSEFMCYVENPNFDPMFFVKEYEEKLDDMLNGYAPPFSIKTSNVAYAFCRYLNMETPNDISVTVTYLEKEHTTIIGATVNFELSEIEKISFKEIDEDIVRNDGKINDNYVLKDYLARKLYYSIKQIGFECEVLYQYGRNFYIIFKTSDMIEWAEKKPFVCCSYRYSTTRDINAWVLNNPTELSKFYNAVSTRKDIVSIVIDDQNIKSVEDLQFEYVENNTTDFDDVKLYR